MIDDDPDVTPTPMAPSESVPVARFLPDINPADRAVRLVEESHQKMISQISGMGHGISGANSPNLLNADLDWLRNEV